MEGILLTLLAKKRYIKYRHKIEKCEVPFIIKRKLKVSGKRWTNN